MAYWSTDTLFREKFLSDLQTVTREVEKLANGDEQCRTSCDDEGDKFSEVL